MNNLAVYGALTPQEKTYLDTLYAQAQPLIHKSMRGEKLTPQEDQQLQNIQAEIARLEKQNRTILQKGRPYAGVIAAGIEYAHSKSFLRAIGALLLPYPYLVYRGYTSYRTMKK